MKRGLALLTGMLLALGGCAGTQAPSPPPESAPAVEAVPAPPEETPPERVVSLNPSITELLWDMGLSSLAAGVEDGCRYPPQAQELPPCGSELLPDVEAILEVRADLVLSLSPLPSSVMEALEEAQIPCVTLDKPDRLEELPDYYEQLARAVLPEGGSEAARAFARPLLAAREAVREAVEGRQYPSGAFAALLPLTLATGDCPQGELLELCGIGNVAAEYTDWRYPQELLLPLDPQVLLIDTRTLSADEVRAHPNYKTTACVTGDRIFEVDGAVIENGGRRLYQLMLDVARFAHEDAAIPESLEVFEGEGASPAEEASSGQDEQQDEQEGD